MTRREDWIWLAGLLEGEGYFGATGYLKDGANRRMVLRVTLTMCDLDVVERAKAIVGADLKTSCVAKRPEHWSDTFTVQWTGKHAEAIMWAVLPYMGVRRSQAIANALRSDAGHRARPTCPNGHPRTRSNQVSRSDTGGMRCRLCEREAGARKRAKARAK